MKQPKIKTAVCIILALLLVAGTAYLGSLSIRAGYTRRSASSTTQVSSKETPKPSGKNPTLEKEDASKVTSEEAVSQAAATEEDPTKQAPNEGNAEQKGSHSTASKPSGSNSKASNGQSSEGNPTGRAPASNPAAGTPCQQHGALSVKGTQLVDKNQQPYQLRGVSIFFLQYANIDSFRTMRDQWGINMVRLPLYTAGYDGYCTSSPEKRAQLKQTIYRGIDAAIDLGLYVIVDWHVLHEGNPNTYRSEAIAFFKEISSKYAGYDNVLYEICNEPNGNASWGSIKSYAENVLPAIKDNAKQAVVIVGTPTWSQDVDQAAADPVTGYDNLMYALHFYAETHRDSLRQKMVTAIGKGLPVFVSEFGICDASGNGTLNKGEAAKWMNLINQYGLSFSIWSLSNKNESSALLLPSTTALSNWSYNDLTESGKWFVDMMGANSASLGQTPANNTESNHTTTTQTDTGNVAAKDPEPPRSEPSQPNTNQSNASGSGKLEAKATVINSWESNGQKFYQYSLEISNVGSGQVDQWSCTIHFSKNVKISQSWCGQYTLNDKSLTITPESYNGVVAPGSTVPNVGFILEVEDGTEVSSITCQ